MQEGSRKAIIAAFFANLGIAIAKFIGFALTGAASMLAEAIHSVADSSNQGLLLMGGKRARRAADVDHPFGYGRERYFWSFVVAMVLFSLGGMFALYEGVQKLRKPHEVESVIVAVVILSLAIVFETFSFRTAIIESNHVRGKASWWQFIRRSKSPELPVVLLEDLGALVGLILALVGVAMAEFTGNPRWDAVGSVSIGLLLLVIAIILAVEMKGLLIGESAAPEMQAKIRTAMEGDDSVQRVIHMRTQHIGPDELLVGAKLEFDAHLGFAEVATAVNRIEKSVRDVCPQARMIYLEPDIARPAGEPAEGAATSPV